MEPLLRDLAWQRWNHLQPGPRGDGRGGDEEEGGEEEQMETHRWWGEEWSWGETWVLSRPLGGDAASHTYWVKLILLKSYLRKQISVVS